MSVSQIAGQWDTCRFRRASVYLRNAAVVLLGLNNLTAVVLKVKQHHNLAHSVVLCGALSHSFLEVSIPAQNLEDRQE